MYERYSQQPAWGDYGKGHTSLPIRSLVVLLVLIEDHDSSSFSFLIYGVIYIYVLPSSPPIS